jgi:hypothetical protein
VYEAPDQTSCSEEANAPQMYTGHDCIFFHRFFKRGIDLYVLSMHRKLGLPFDMHSPVHEVTVRFTTILIFLGFAWGRGGCPLFEENFFF